MILQAIVHLWILMHMPVEAPIESYNITAEKYETVLSAVKREHQVETAFVCVSKNDIECIDDTCNYRQGHYYWTIKVNGDYTSYNANTVVSPKDKIRLEYAFLRER